MYYKRKSTEEKPKAGVWTFTALKTTRSTDKPLSLSDRSGHKWAEPSVSHLQVLMRRVSTHPEEAATRGANARSDMVRRYAPATVAAAVMNELRRVAADSTWAHDEL